MRSIRSRLITGILVGMTVFFAAGGVYLYGRVRATMMDQVERSLFADFQSNAGSVAGGVLKLGSRWSQRREEREGERDGERPFYLDPKARTEIILQAWHGEDTYKSLSLGADDLPRLAADLAPVPLEDVQPRDMRYATVALPGTGETARACSIRFTLVPRRPWERGDDDEESEPRVIELVIAKPIDAVLETLGSVRWLLAGTWLTCVLASAAILFGVVDRSLRPLRRLQREIETVDEGRLSHRFRTESAPSELAPVVRRLNELLERLQGAFEREQSFTSDVAHELRTPLAGLRATLEVLLARPRTTADHEEAARECLGITHQTQDLVESLLELARVSSGRQAIELHDVPLRQLLSDCWESRAEDAARRGLRLRDEVDPAIHVRTDPSLARRLFENLLDNAVEYADEGTTIELRAELLGAQPSPDAARPPAGPTGGRVRVVLANDTRGLPEDAGRRVFDAFWRADAARSAVGRHAGIGLSLCKRVAQRLGGAIHADTRGGRFVVTVELDRAQRARAAAPARPAGRQRPSVAPGGSEA